jgi:hypothetical protein
LSSLHSRSASRARSIRSLTTLIIAASTRISAALDVPRRGAADRGEYHAGRRAVRDEPQRESLIRPALPLSLEKGLQASDYAARTSHNGLQHARQLMRSGLE